MRSLFNRPWIAALLLMAVLIWLGFYRKAPPKAVPVAVQQKQAAPASVPPTRTISDPVEVFQRAFWKRPTENDKILHAERREWADQQGIQKWSWFIAVEPSPDLLKHLRVDNAFNLTPAASVPSIENPPSWFIVDSNAFDVLHAFQGGMYVFFGKTRNLLYAADAGGGFHAGAPEPPTPLPGNTLPTSLPLKSSPSP